MTKEQKPNLGFVTEAWMEHPKARPLSDIDAKRYNGVVHTYHSLEPHLAEHYNPHFVTPFDYPGPEGGILTGLFCHDRPYNTFFQRTIRLVDPSDGDMDQRLDALNLSHVHIATEGPLGRAAMRWAKRRDKPVSVCHHTKWYDYIDDPKYRVPRLLRPMARALTEKYLADFYKQADAVMAGTPGVRAKLISWGIEPERIHMVGRGADPAIFHPRPASERPIPEPYIISHGRLAPGKNLEEFCALQSGNLKKVLVGDGDLRTKLQRDYPDVLFAGFKQGEELGRWVACAELFGSASTSETLGIVFREAMACGTPVLAKNQGDHVALFDRDGLAVLDNTLQGAFNKAAANPGQFLPREAMAAHAQRTGWKSEADNFMTMIEACAPRPALSPDS